jgi:hypothetical protein
MMVYRLLLCFLFCNVLALGLEMVTRGAGWMEYVNLAGCVMFGGFLAWRHESA